MKFRLGAQTGACSDFSRRLLSKVYRYCKGANVLSGAALDERPADTSQKAAPHGLDMGSSGPSREEGSAEPIIQRRQTCATSHFGRR